MSSSHARLNTIASILASTPDFDAQVSALTAAGIAEAEAEHWADLMPVAFARAAYRFQYQGPYPLDKQRDLQGRPPLNEDAIYQQASAWACDCGAMDYLDPQVFNRVVKSSPEYDFIREKSEATTAH